MFKLAALLILAALSAINAAAGPPVLMSLVKAGCYPAGQTEVTISTPAYSFYLNPGQSTPGGMEFSFQPAQGGPAVTFKVPSSTSATQKQKFGLGRGHFKLTVYILNQNGGRLPNTSSPTYGVVIGNCPVTMGNGGVRNDQLPKVAE